MYRRLVIHRNAFSSYGALSIIKQEDFQFTMNDNIFAFRGLNHSRKSSTIYWLIIIHARRTFVQSTSIPIKMNKRNFMSLVPDVASIEIILLWPHESINWHWIDFYDVNCEWHLYPIDFTNFMEVENILWVLESPRLNKDAIF